MYKVIATDLALNDLEKIIRYVTDNLSNPTAAEDFLTNVDDCYKNLSHTPQMYSRCLDTRLRDMNYRRAVIQNYIMVYRLDENTKTVYVLRFFYGARKYVLLL